MKSFFKFTFATILGFILSILLIVLILTIVVNSSEEEIEIEPNSVLQIELNQNITDRGSDNPLENFNPTKMAAEKHLGLNEILESIKSAKEDENIKGIYLNLTSLSTGMASIEEIRNALIDFKTSKKIVISYADSYSQKSYYLASVSDKVYLHPEGSMFLIGMGAEVMYFKGMLDKMGVEATVIRHGGFKSAAEPFMQEEMSDKNREQIESYIGSIWEHMLKGIANERQIQFDKLENWVEEFEIRFPKHALEYGLIDGIKFKDDILSELKDITKAEKIDDIKLVKLSKYSNVASPLSGGKGITKDKIAVVYATGQINMGQGDHQTIGSDKISAAIRKARLDDNVKAVVLRINSPGGSALASDVIWREVILTQKEKPVIASMGDVAASGGYYIACAANKIIASPNTITGSIGVFGVFFNASEGLKEWFGINVNRVKTNKYADLGSAFRPITENEKVIIQEQIDTVYSTFINHVAMGRNMKLADVDSIGQGRVWSGVNAMEIGLIDEFGGLDKAIIIAAKEAELDKYRIIELPERKPLIEQIMEEFGGNTEASIIQENLGENYKYVRVMNELPKMQGIQARLPYKIEIN